MGKSKRGKAISGMVNWRGTCPLCKRQRVKLVWQEGAGKEALKICKACYGRINKK